MTARWQRIPAAHADQPGEECRPVHPVPLRRRPPSPEAMRHDFANLVVRRLITPGARIAVIEEHGRPALVSCAERLYELLSKDHPIVGVYTVGAVVKDVVDDLKAAGL